MEDEIVSDLQEPGVHKLQINANVSLSAGCVKGFVEL